MLRLEYFFSKNVNHNVSEELNNALGFSRAADLDKYLGVHLHNGRVTKATYNKFVVDKVRSRLSRWKVRSLSLAGTGILLKATVNLIPNHIMLKALWVYLINHEINFIMELFLLCKKL